MNTPIRSFRDLIVWQRGMELAKTIYQWTERMPAEEKFGLTRQIRRAAVSIPSNIAEGYARNSKVDYIRFLRIARGSIAELMTQIELAVDLHPMQRSNRVDDLLTETDRLLNGLIQSLTQKENR